MTAKPNHKGSLSKRLAVFFLAIMMAVFATAALLPIHVALADDAEVDDALVPAAADPTLTLTYGDTVDNPNGSNNVDVLTLIGSVKVNGAAWSHSTATVSGQIPAGVSVTINVAPTDDAMATNAYDESRNLGDFNKRIREDGTGTITFTMPEGDATVSIYFAQAVNITLDANGGTTGPDWPASNISKTVRARAGIPHNIILPDSYPASYVSPPTGMTFNGLEVTYDGGVSSTGPGGTISNVTFVNGGKFKYLWVEAPATHTVTFNLNGGAINGSTEAIKQDVPNGGKATNPGSPVKSNLTFDGWYNGTHKLDFNTDTFTEDTEFTAKYYGAFEAVAYDKVGRLTNNGGIIKVNGASEGATSYTNAHVDEGSSITLTAEAYSNFRFVGWAIGNPTGDIVSEEATYTIASYNGQITKVYAVFCQTAIVSFRANDGTTGNAWISSVTVDINTNLNELLGDTVPSEIDPSIVTAPSGTTFGGYRIKDLAGEGIVDLLPGAPIDFSIGGNLIVTYQWLDPVVTIHWSSIDGVDVVDPIATDRVPVGSSVDDALTTIDKDIDSVFFSDDDYVDSGYRVPKPMTEYSSSFALYLDDISGSDTVDGTMDIYVVMFKKIDTVEVTFDSVPEAGTSTETQSSGSRWLWSTQTNPPSVSLPDGINYTFDNYDEGTPWAFWIAGTGVYDPYIGTFKAGKSYLANIYLAANYGYTFAEDPVRTVNGAEEVGHKWDSEYYGIDAKVTLDPPPTAKLTFDLDGGTLNGQTGTVTITAYVGETIKLPGAPTKEGYTFKYWRGSEYQAGAEYEVVGDHPFTAVWEKNPDSSGSATPGTGDDVGTVTLVLVLAAFGSLLVLAGRALRRRGREQG